MFPTHRFEQYEIFANTAVVDLLVSLTYVAAYENALLNSLPTGLGIRLTPLQPYSNVQMDRDGMCDLDSLNSKEASYC